MSNVKVQDLVKEIKDNLSQVSSSSKDEVRVMQAMLNDTSYEVGVYTAAGLKETYNPSQDFRGMLSNLISGTTKISKEESAASVPAGNTVRYEVIADLFQIAQIESAMREYGIKFRRV